MRILLIALICVITPCHIWAQDMLGEGAIIDKGNNLDENTQALEDVAAAGVADPVKRKVDRIVFDAQTIAADNLNLYDILLATPSVVATEEDISIAGKGRALVLIDDKESRRSILEMVGRTTYRCATYSISTSQRHLRASCHLIIEQRHTLPMRWQCQDMISMQG